MKTSFFDDLSKSFLYKVLGLVITFGIQIFITRTIGIDNYGVWNTAISWMQIILILSLGGNTKELLRSASGNQKDAFGKLINIGIQVLVTYIILYGLYWLVLSMTGYTDSLELYIAVIIAFFFGIMQMLNKVETSMMQAIQKNYLSIFNRRIILPIVKAVLIALLFLLLGNKITILASYPIAEGVAVMVFFYLIIKNYSYKDWEWKSKIFFNFHFWINDIAKTLLPFINIAILSFLISDSDIGGYSASYRIGEFLMFFTTIFISFSPVIVRYLKENQRKELQSAYLTINKVLLVVVFPFFLFLLVFSNTLLSVFGQAFSEYSLVLQILIVGVYMDAVTGPIGEMLNMSGNENIEKNINIFAASLNVVLLFVLTFFYGIIGAAIAYAIPRAIANISKLVFVKRVLRIRTLSPKHLKIILLQFLCVVPFLIIDDFSYRTVTFITVIMVFVVATFGFEWAKIDEFKKLKAI